MIPKTWIFVLSIAGLITLGIIFGPQQEIDTTVVVPAKVSEKENEIIISGNIDKTDVPVTILVANDRGDLITVAQVMPSEEGSFSYSVMRQGPLWENIDKYSVKVQYQDPSAKRIKDAPTMKFILPDFLPQAEARSLSAFSFKIDEKYAREGHIDFIVERGEYKTLPVEIVSLSNNPVTVEIHTTIGNDQMGPVKMPGGVKAYFEPDIVTLQPEETKQVNLVVDVDKNAPAYYYDLQIVGSWKEQGKVPDFMGSSIRLHVGRDFGTDAIPINFLSPPYQFYKEGVPAGEIPCRNDYVIVVKESNGHPACVSFETKNKLVKRGWGIDYESLVSMIEKSDEIITAMIAGEEIFPNGYRNVWLSTYEWLKSGVYDEGQLFLEQNKANNPEALNVKFNRGEEVLLFVKEVDEKRGAYDIFPIDDIPPQKYSIVIRDTIVDITKPDYSGIKKEFDFSSAKGCSQKDLDGDSYWHCSSMTPFYVSIETTMSLVKEKILQHISEQYFDEHFDLVSTSDVSVVNGKETPIGQSITFVYTIDDMRFLYSIDTSLEREFDEVYLRFVPPKQLDSIIHDDKQIDRLAYSCLDSGDYKIYWQPYRIGNHIDKGFSPFIGGAGPPTVYDRWGDDPIQRSEKTFRIWLVNGDVECKFRAEEFEPDKFGRPENILLIDSTKFQRIKSSN